LVEIRSSKAQKQAPKDTDKNKLREPVKPETVSAKPVKTPLAAPVEKPVAATEQPVEMGIDQLIQAAYAELARGDLPGTLRLARQLDQLYRLHPQVRRLAREVASRYHQSARALLVAGNLEKAGNELDLAKQVIQEFNLIEMNPAHELLRRKL
jgi:type IV secretory pathway VirB10-like protein